jgi:serine protease Do
MAQFVKLGMENKYKEGDKVAKIDRGGFTGIVLVVHPSGLMSTPPYVEEVVPGSPAAKAELRPDDLILYVEGFSVPTIKTYRDTMRMYAPGDDVRLQVQRGSKLESVVLKLEKQPKAPASN